MNIRFAILTTLLLIAIGSTASAGHAYYNPKANSRNVFPKVTADEIPNWGFEVHKINKMWLSVSNGGTFGIGFAGSYIDPETGEPAPSCEYPANSDVTYLYYGAFWAGAVVGRDTLVSIGIADFYDVREFWPTSGPEGAITRRSNMKNSLDYSPQAVSEQDFICAYTDTFTDVSLTGQDPIDNRPHVPLGIEVKQRTFAWSYEYAEDFIMFDFTIRNINRFPLKEVYFGIFVDADVWHESNSGGTNYTDDICGYLHDIPSPNAPGFLDTVRIAWTADNDGDPNADAGNVFDYTSATSVTGTAVLRAPVDTALSEGDDDVRYSFNWWITNYGNAALDWGPRLAGTEEKPFRSFGPRLGTPRGDRNKYYVLSSNEFDYGQLYSAVSHTDQGYLAPPRPEDAVDFADGFDARYLFSFGPFNLQPGDTLPITLAYVAGEDFHQKGSDFITFWDPFNPGLYESRLNFSNLGKNALWAHWVFDNPGYDTDGDGDSGKFHWVVDTTFLSGADSIKLDSSKYWYRGDGVPDFRGAAPPPPPMIRVTPEFGRLRIQWNGKDSEDFLDIFSGEQDFEGYRVYLGRDNRESDYVLMAAYDRENYNIYSFDAERRLWNISPEPISRDSINAFFGADFDPSLYPRPEESYFKNGIAYYFVPQDWNQDDLDNPLGIHRLYPDADPNDPGDTNSNGDLRYYEYEYIVDNLQPSVPYYVTVTAFDYGSRKVDLSSLESAKNLNAVLAYPLPSSEIVEEQGLQVGVYPNPYRIDGGYARAGYENRDRTKSAERARAIHFYNLPNVCTIRIFSIDGDLIREIDHYFPGGGPDAQHEEWNLISRNTQAVVTGIYLYHVKSEMGEQLGKIVIIK
jgi:hypothetical protein